MMMWRLPTRTHGSRFRLAAAGLAALGCSSATVYAQGSDTHFWPGNLVVSRSVYHDDHALQAGVTVLPPNCVSGCVTATADGAYPLVWNNALVDGSFGITSKIYLDQLTPWGDLVGSLEVPSSHDSADRPDHLVTSFSSKSELALHLSTDGRYLTFMGYLAPISALDVSNANTPGEIDSTNPVTGAAYRAVAQVDRNGQFRFTLSNAYSGDNGRAAIMHSGDEGDVFYTAGNAGNGSNPQPDGIILGAGAQILAAADAPERDQLPGAPTPVGSFNITQLGYKHDKIGKDDNFRGIAIFNNVLFFTKGSGGNGINTVYFLDVTGQACPGGVGLPADGVKLPNAPLPYDSALLQTEGLQPNNLCILRGFPNMLNSALTAKTTAYPFALWFADEKTVYVADEGDGVYGDAGQTSAGLQKWVFDSASASWQLAYTLQSGLGVGQTYHFPDDDRYPTGNNAATGLPWAPLTDGLRNITGRVNGDGTVTVWAITSTVSGNGDQGADPNKLVVITDRLNNTNAAVATKENFTTLRTARYGEVLRGVAFAPGTGPNDQP